jgi:hypothetical protein
MKKKWSFSALLLYQAAALLRKKEENTLNLGLKKKGLIQRIAGKKGLAGLAGVLGLLGLLACGLAGLRACWPTFFSFPLLPFASSFYFGSVCFDVKYSPP